MELDQLRYFLRVAETKSFTRAAELLIVSQPALSRSVQKLEEELGVPLLVRKSRSLELSDAGEKFKSRAEQILALVDETKIQLTDDGKKGRIRIGAIPTIAPYFLPAFLRTFAKRFPQAISAVYEDTTKNLLHQIAQGEIDLAVLALPVSEKHLEVQSLFDEELLVALPRDHALCEKSQLRLKDLEEVPFVMLDEPHCLSDTILSFCRSRSLQPVVVGRTNQLSTVQELVSLNHGISMVPKMAEQLDHAKTRVYRSLAGPPLKRTIGVVWDPHRFQSRLVKNTLAVLREHCHSLEN
ncbi:MAG: LysR family transcriptional regulator [Planctomycetaceae bacterium]|nr:LysR family transcriptional regulator [Planctomycetaceae bacterium]